MEEKKFEFLPHTADARFRAYGRDLEEAAANAALAMVSLMWEYDKVEPMVRQEVEVQARSLETLLVKFLTEILYLFEVKRFLLGRVEKLKIRKPAPVGAGGLVQEQQAGTDPGQWLLQAVLAGDNRPERYELVSEVKAATYNDFRLEKGPDGVQLEMVVDL